MSILQRFRESELGFGTKTSGQRSRLINRNGSFNIRRVEQSRWKSSSLYHTLITLHWWKFNLIVFAYFVLVNVVFASLYYYLSPNGIVGAEASDAADRFLNAFFFSTQTISTVGFGRLSPGDHMTNAIAAVESLMGLLGFALVTGLLYGRFSRPKARLLQSDHAIIAPFKGARAWQCRIANKMRNSQLTHMEAKVTVAKVVEEDGVPVRRFFSLELELKSIVFFPMTWTLNHPINADSPLFGMEAKDYEKADVEFLISITGFDDTFSQTVHTRLSYTWQEMLHGARFVSVFGKDADGGTSQDLRKLSATETAALPAWELATV
ncbi:MAG: potassium transporter [Flavobacteriales bacterium]|nr:potassium transporter [Flavobacteriales bacterium]